MRILLLTHRLPYPPNRGDKIRTFNVLAHLARHHEVRLACPVDDPADLAHVPALEKLCAEVVAEPNTGGRAAAGLLALATASSITVRHFHFGKLQDRIDALIDAGEVDAVFCFSSPMAEYVFRSRHAHGKLRSDARLMDLIDVDSYKWRQYAQRSRGPLSWVYAYEAARLGNYERRISREFDELFLVSAQERDYMPAGANTDHLHALGNGVDLEYFSPRTDGRVAPPTIVFTGVMDYPPNVQGAQWFADEVLPLILAQRSDARFVIVGSKPTEAVRRLGQRPNIEVTGFVDDVRVFVAGASVCIAPLKIARGVQNKVLEAMAMGKAVVCTPQALEGIRVPPGDAVVVASDASGYAAQVLELIGAPERAAQLGAAARRCMEQHYSWSANLQPLDALLARLDANRAPRSAAVVTA
jgi:sugar transferase (PEP-CTERM/EpsH1 system associated)